jgi:hypothetical protein
MRPPQCFRAFVSVRKDEKDASDDAFVLKMFSRGRRREIRDSPSLPSRLIRRGLTLHLVDGCDNACRDR